MSTDMPEFAPDNTESLDRLNDCAAEKQVVSFWIKNYVNNTVELAATWDRQPPAGVHYMDHIKTIGPVFDKVIADWGTRRYGLWYNVHTGKQIYAMLLVNMDTEEKDDNFLYKGYQFVLDQKMGPLDLTWTI